MPVRPVAILWPPSDQASPSHLPFWIFESNEATALTVTLMPPFNSASLAVLALVTLQRVGELLYAHRNESRLRARGAIEHASQHYWTLVSLHSAWLAGLWLLAPQQPINLFWLTL